MKQRVSPVRHSENTANQCHGLAVPAHGGNLRELASASGKAERDILDFSANINPLGPPEWLRPLISSHVTALTHYPDPECAALVEAAAQRYGVAPEEIAVGNGSTELLHLFPRVLGKKRAVIPVPCYSDYARACQLAGMSVETMPLHRADGFSLDLALLEAKLGGNEIVFLCRPNNPTGHICDADAIRSLAARHSATTFLVDEAFGDFVEGFDSLTQRRPANVIVLLSLTKLFAIPGLRLGCAIADRVVIQRLRELQPSWSVNTLAQAVGVAALRDREYVRQTQLYVCQQREALAATLNSLPGLTVYHGAANFLLIRLDRNDFDAPRLAQRLLADGIAIRVCDNFDGLDSRYFRIAVRREEENTFFCDRLRAALGVHRPAPLKRRTPAIMFQGTSSNAGKSILTAAFCRILLQDGFRVAPFKSQNMSLNSFVTRDGCEMGRAQVVQAQACRIEPSAAMNPILLKPNSDTGSQVILMGKPVGNMNVGEYIRFKPQAFETAKQAYESLAADYDAIVLEGAGSPAEVNLKHHDIVNMSMARHAGAPVLLVGDIDRGGVFASFVGTMEVLAEWERDLIAGFVVNKFRGNEPLLKDALDYTAHHTGRPVLGVVPYLQNLGLPDEDSVTFKAAPRGAAESAANGDYVEIAVVDLPHISNFTDFDALRLEPDVHLRIVRSAADLGQPDAVILPGSKNVIGDLTYLRQHNFDDAIHKLADAGKTEFIGICGGYQMLGTKIGDPHSIESAGQTICGLGLLPLSTVLEREKILRRVTAKHAPSGLTVHGYEIHHGQSGGDGLQPLVFCDDGEMIGAGSANNLAWGTYLHGLFDADEFRRWFVNRLRARRGLPALSKICTSYDLEPAFERLAEVVRKSLNVAEIYRLMGLR
ncbi:MAG: cobyric acid synthase [Verrucomicrobia bacterium]|nr:cobyric acid synthase [Verrucomicrobiota bacterium]